MDMWRKIRFSKWIAVLALVCWSSPQVQAGQNLCEIPAVSGRPDIRVISREAFVQSAIPCAQLLPGSFDRYVVLVGAFAAAGTDDVLTRIGAISSLKGIKYWSVKDADWQTLITDAEALESMQGKVRTDFSPAELKAGKAFYFRQSDNRSSGSVLYRLEILEITPERVGMAVENVSPVKYMLFTVLRPGDVRSVYVFEKIRDGAWAYYNLYGVRERWPPPREDTAKSYGNRAVAMFRHFTGVLTDMRPPAMP
jgi:hypothetical protein